MAPLGAPPLGAALSTVIPVLLLTALSEARIWEPIPLARVYPPAPPNREFDHADHVDDDTPPPRDVIREPTKDAVRDPYRDSRDPRDVVRDPRDVVRDSVDTVRDPRDVARDSRDVVRDSIDIVRDPRDVVRDPRDVIRDLRDVVRDPRGIVRDPRDVIVRDPRGIARDPRDFVRDPVDRVLVTSRDGRATLFERIAPEEVRAAVPTFERQGQAMHERMPSASVSRMFFDRPPPLPPPPASFQYSGYERPDWSIDRPYRPYPGEYMYVPVQRARRYDNDK